MIFSLTLSPRESPIFDLVADPDKKSEHGTNENTEKKYRYEYNGKRAGVSVFRLSAEVNGDRIAIEKEDIAYRCRYKSSVDKQSNSACRHRCLSFAIASKLAAILARQYTEC